MVRSAASILSVAILSGFVVAQQVPTHTVVDGDTLWDLAQRYYQSPWEWRRIWEANRDRVADPNLIYPDQVLTIPGPDATVSDVVVEGPPSRPPPPAQRPMTDVHPSQRERTVFFQDTAVMRAGVVRTEALDYYAVPRDWIYSAPWLVRLGEEPAHAGEIEDFVGNAGFSDTPRAYDRVTLAMDGSARVGDQFRTFRVTRTIRGVGHVVTPTGMVTVADVSDGRVVAIVTKELHRMALGDLVGEVPAYAYRPGQLAERVNGGSEAMVMGFAGRAEIQDIGTVAFLDLGSDEGVAIGDEFEYVNPRAGEGVVQGRLQVVGVTPGVASARIIGLDDDVFEPGIVVRLSKKMR